MTSATVRAVPVLKLLILSPPSIPNLAGEDFVWASNKYGSIAGQFIKNHGFALTEHIKSKALTHWLMN
jgi:hypothetical protein